MMRLFWCVFVLVPKHPPLSRVVLFCLCICFFAGVLVHVAQIMALVVVLVALVIAKFALFPGAGGSALESI